MKSDHKVHGLTSKEHLTTKLGGSGAIRGQFYHSTAYYDSCDPFSGYTGMWRGYSLRGYRVVIVNLAARCTTGCIIVFQTVPGNDMVHNVASA